MAQQQPQQPQQQPGAGQIDYVSLLSGLSDSDGDRRKQAEDVYNAIPAQDRFSLLGASLCRRELPEPVRVFAAVLLRRLVLNSWTDISSAVPAPQLLLSCNQLLEILKESVNDTSEIRDKISQVVEIIAKNYVNDGKKNEWTHFLQFMFECLGGNNDVLMEVALKIMAAQPDVFGRECDQTNYLPEISTYLANCFNISKGKPDSFNVALAAATCSLITSNSHNKDCVKKLSGFAQFLTTLLETVPSETAREDICQSMIEVAELAPLSFRPAAAQLIQVCIKIMTESDGLESDLRYSALELTVSIIENAPGMMKKRAPHLIKPVVLRILALMTSIEDDPDWYTACTNDKDNDEPDAIGESALDRVSIALGGKILLPILMEELTAMLQRPEWQARHAALMAFSSAGEGCRNHLMHDLDRVVNGILTFLEDPHPRVRHAACNAIGQMASDFAPEFEQKFHSRVVPGLCKLTVDFSNIRVQAHAACAMINFFEQFPQEILSGYLGPITEHIELALSRYMSEGIPKEEGKIFVVENIIVALSSVADSSGEAFVDYYEKFMTCLKFIIKETTGNEELRLFRGKAIECISLIGMAVGKEKFCKDASEIMQMLLATQTGDLKLADDDPQLSYMMAAWARICRILGQDFQTYLPYVMEPVLRAASLKVEIALLNDEDRAAIENSEDWESVSVQDQAVGIKTAGLEDKATACSMLVCYAREMKQGFAEYVERTAEVLIPLLKFPFHEDVRCAAAEAMPYLLESIKPKGEQCVLTLWNLIFENLINSLDVDADNSIIGQLFDSIAGCIEIVGVASMTPERYTKLTEKLLEKFKLHFDNLAEEFERRKDEDYETESECSTDEEEFLSGIAGVIHSLFEVYKADYLPYFQPIIEPILKLSVNDQAIPWSNRQTALCMWDDLIEYTGQNAVNYQKFFLPLLSNGVVDKRVEIRQAALYGVGLLAQHNGTIFAEFLQGIVPNIIQVINHPEARTEDFIMATENGISSVAKILKYCPQLPNHNDLLKLWVDWLPIWEDDAEVPFVMGYLLELIEQNNQTVMGVNSSNLPRLVAIVAEVFARSVIEVNTEVGGKLVSFLKQIHANPSLSGCLASLSIPQQKAVQEVIAG